MDDLDRGVLNVIQDRFPIEERPYLAIANELDASEDDVIACVASLSERGIIRDPSPVFDLRKLGYCSTLVAINVAPERIDEVTEIINRREEVTHNYLREGEPNTWFTVIAESEEARDRVLADIEDEVRSGMIYRFPSTRMFRARVVFDFGPSPRKLGNSNNEFPNEFPSPLPGGEGATTAGKNACATGENGRVTTTEPGDADWAIIEVLQDGIPAQARAYDALAERAGLGVDEFLERMRRLADEGIIRRMGVRVRHHKAGISGNVMSVWRVPDEDTERVGLLFSSMPEVSHCYTRTTYPDFPHNMYAMLHAKTEGATAEIIARMVSASGITDYLTLTTVAELKKSTPRYRKPRG